MTIKRDSDCVIALEGRLRHCSNVITLGVKTNFSDYSADDARMIRDANKIYYPSIFYADLFDAVGKPTFPSYHTYKCVQDKIKQTALLNMLGIAHPRTRVFYGKRQKQTITQHFAFPFIAKIPRGSAMGRVVYLVTNHDELTPVPILLIYKSICRWIATYELLLSEAGWCMPTGGLRRMEIFAATFPQVAPSIWMQCLNLPLNWP